MRKGDLLTGHCRYCGQPIEFNWDVPRWFHLKPDNSHRPGPMLKSGYVGKPQRDKMEE